jgi:subtilase family serine protease
MMATPQKLKASRRLGIWLLVALVALAASPATAVGQSSTAPSLPACLNLLGDKQCFGPSQIRSAYNLGPLLHQGFTGRGRTIAIIDSFGSSTIRSDLHAFDQAFSLPDPRLDILSPIGKTKGGDAGWVGETTLDVEWAHALAPGARIVLLTSPVNETEGVQGLPQFLSLERYALSHHLGDVISQSWAVTEETLMNQRGRSVVAQFHNFYNAATKQGVTIIGPSGDDGTAGLDLSLKHVYPFRTVQWPSSDPLVLAVGGTRLQVSKSGPSETAWVGSGGGVSKLFREPAYQLGLSSAVQRVLGHHRGLPDVAINASNQNPVLIYVHGRWGIAGGTSVSVPEWAALMALADSKADHDLGDIHSALYQLARSPRYHVDMRDVTAGAIDDPAALKGKLPKLRAKSGWDPTTGLGTPRAAPLTSDLICLARAQRTGDRPQSSCLS